MIKCDLPIVMQYKHKRIRIKLGKVRKVYLVLGVDEEVDGSVFFSNDRDSIPDLEFVQVDSVVVDDGRSVVHHAVPSHHPERSGNFGCNKVQVSRLKLLTF